MARFILVHGACHTAWCWQLVAPQLQAQGHEVAALDMPGRAGDPRAAGTLTLADHARTILAAADGPSILVGHSAGGFSISAAAEADPSRVSRLVFLAALLPQDGDSLVRKMQSLTPTGDRAKFSRTPDGQSYTFEEASSAPLLYNGVPQPLIAQAMQHIVPEPGAPHRERIALGPAFSGVPKSFIRCTEDRVIPAVDQARMAAEGGADLLDLATGHSPFLSEPEALARLLDGVAA